MKPITVLIVDDEPLAQGILESYIARIPGLVLAGKCRNALEAFGVLNKQDIDLMLLDINMPEINGMDFLRSLKNPPLVIFTTAYSEYALDSYELNAIDYLLKPISFERFVKAINKVREIAQPEPVVRTTGNAESRDILFVKTEGKLVKIDLSKLWLIEGLKDYLRLWADNNKIVVHSTMKNMEEQLAGLNEFVRVNKSYIINIRYVTEVDGNSIRIKDQLITVGNTYRDEINALLNKYKLL